MDTQTGPDNPHQSQPGPTPPPQPSGTGGSDGFFSWVRSLGISRDSRERWFAGVAGGVARKAGIDPLIVRGIFVVLALLGGPGLLLYLAGWLVLPDEHGKIHTEELVRGRAHPGVIVAGVLVGLWLVGTIVAGINFPSIRMSIWGVPGIPVWVGTTFTWIFWLAVLAGVGFLIHRIVLQHGQSQQTRGSQYGWVPPDSDPPQAFTESRSQASPTPADRTSAWSAAYAEQYEYRKLGAAHLLITISLALIAAGGAALWVSQSSADGEQVTMMTIGALVAGTSVLGLSMIVAGLRGKGSGAVGVLGFLAVVSLGVTALLPVGTTYQVVGDNTITDAAPASFSVVGDTTIDLAVYDTDPTLTQVDITQVVGDVNLDLSQVRPTRFTMDVAAGTIEANGLDWQHHSGVMNRRTITVNEDAPGEMLYVNVRLLAGTVTINNY